MFFLDDCMEYTGYKSDTSIRIGLTNLYKMKLLLEEDMKVYISSIQWLHLMGIE